MTNVRHGAVLTPEWDLPDGVNAFYTSRQGGESLAPYDSFNIATHVDDDLIDVKTNRSHLPLHDKIGWLNQVHSARCVNLSDDYLLSLEPAKADASFTSQKGLVCAVMTADCLPILITSKDATSVAAVHAGWRGLANGVIQNTVAAMQCNAASLSVWVGPHISQPHFQVGEDVRQAFSQYSEAFIADSSGGKYLCSLFHITQSIFHQMGVSEIINSDICTYANHKQFYSYRHARHQEQSETGRLVSGIYRS